MKALTITLLLFIGLSSSAQTLYPELFDGSTGITAGYGAWGANDYIRETSIDVPSKGTITFYHPTGAVSQKPTVIFISGWGRQYDSYDRYFKYVASLGYSVINIYNLSPGSINTSYQNSIDMIGQAQTTYSTWIDTTRIGLAGHSYGGGSTIWIGNQLFDSAGLNWGTNGRFILMFAPWYPFLITDTELQNYPSNVKLAVVQSYDDFSSSADYTYNTDPRALRAMYQLINIPDAEKDYITVFSDADATHEYSYGGATYSYEANHFMSYTALVNGVRNPYDRLDVFAMNRLTHAMTAYVFGGDLVNAKDVILGNGSAAQIAMGIMPDLAVTDYYIATRPESEFDYKCTADAAAWSDPAIWKLYDYCVDTNNDGVIDALRIQEQNTSSFSLFPVPAQDFVQIKLEDETEVILSYEIFDVSGKKLIKKVLPDSNIITIKDFAKGNYFIKISTEKSVGVQQFIVK